MAGKSRSRVLYSSKCPELIACLISGISHRPELPAGQKNDDISQPVQQPQTNTFINCRFMGGTKSNKHTHTNKQTT